MYPHVCACTQMHTDTYGMFGSAMAVLLTVALVRGFEEEN